jgi:hypothetical protein
VTSPPTQGGQRDRLVRVVELNLRQDQSGIGPAELIDFPDQALERDEVADLLDQRRLAHGEQLVRVGHGDLVFVLGAHRAAALALTVRNASGPRTRTRTVVASAFVR